MSSALDLAALTRAGEAAARAGGTIVLAGFDAPTNAREKTAGDWVSDVDTASERAVAAVLAEAAPGIAFFGEESGGERAALGWICDPLDGTAAPRSCPTIVRSGRAGRPRPLELAVLLAIGSLAGAIPRGDFGPRDPCPSR